MYGNPFRLQSEDAGEQKEDEENFSLQELHLQGFVESKHRKKKTTFSQEKTKEIHSI